MTLHLLIDFFCPSKQAQQALAPDTQTEIGVALDCSEGKSGALSYLVLTSVLDTACGTGLEDASCPLFKLCLYPLQLAAIPLGHAALYTAILILLKGHEKCGWVARETRMKREERNHGRFLKR